MIPTNRVRAIPGLDMDITRRGNYDSGEDFVLEYGELRFTFNEQDFAERCEQAAIKVGFVGGRLGEEELEDLVNLAVNGEISEPASALGEHVNDCWPELIGPAERARPALAHEQLRAQRAAREQVEDRLAARRRERRVERDHRALPSERLARRRDQRQRARLAQVARRRERLARALRLHAVEPVD